MTEESGFSSEFDEKLDNILPDDLEDIEAADEHTLAQYTIGHSRTAEENSETARHEMEAVGSELELPESVVAMGMQLFEQYQGQESLQGRVVELVADACLYCSCKVNEIPIDPGGFSAATGELSTRKRLLRRVKAIASELGLDVAMFLDVFHYIPRYCDELGLSDEVADRAEEIVDLCEEAGLASGKSPSGWAAAAVYNAALEHGERVTQSDISKVANVTEVTIRNRYQEQQAHIQTVDGLPEDAIAAVREIGETISFDEDGLQVALDLVTLAQYVGPESTWEPIPLAVAAVHLASQRIGNPVGYRTLNQFLKGDSDQICRVESDLKTMARKNQGLHPLIYESGGGIPRPSTFESRKEFESARTRIIDALVATQEGGTYPDRWHLSKDTNMTDTDIEQAYGTYSLATLFADRRTDE